MAQSLPPAIEFPRAAPTGAYAAILGDHPSQYSRSPAMWNAALAALGLPAEYVPLDSPPDGLASRLAALRADPNFVGGNVTVPHKVAVLPLLDEVDEAAARIGAVNTLARTPAGGLIGHNTDGAAGVQALTLPFPDEPAPLSESLAGRRVLLLGAGGAARALAFALAEALGVTGRLHIANRDAAKAAALARSASARFGNADSVPMNAVPEVAAASDLIVNATRVGQRGSPADGAEAADLEPVSPLGELDLALADPDRRQAAVRVNHEASRRVLARVPTGTAVWDIIYAPAETVLLRHARETGHRTLNGRSLLVRQAAAAFCHFVFRESLAARGLVGDEAYRRVVDIMARQ